MHVCFPRMGTARARPDRDLLKQSGRLSDAPLQAASETTVYKLRCGYSFCFDALLA